MSALQVFIPGDTIPTGLLPPPYKRRVGHGLHQEYGSGDFTCTVSGPLQIDHKRKAARISTPTARYIPAAGDLIIAQIRSMAGEHFMLHINSHSQQAILPVLAFEGATRKTRPQLKTGDLVYAKVVFAQKNMEVELSCVNPSTGRAEPDGLGPLNGGMVFDVSVGLAEKMLKKEDVSFLEEIGSKLQGGFEIAVGKNGKVWVDCPDAAVKGVCAVGRCLSIVDETVLDAKEQKRLVSRVIHELGLG